MILIMYYKYKSSIPAPVAGSSSIYNDLSICNLYIDLESDNQTDPNIPGWSAGRNAGIKDDFHSIQSLSLSLSS